VAGKRRRPAKKTAGTNGGSGDANPAAPAKRAAGNPSYAGYEYQIGVTVWAGLDLMLAKEATETLIIEPRSHEDIEAAVVQPETALLNLSAGNGGFKLVIQVKSKSTEPWTAAEFADVLVGKQDESLTRSTGARQRPLAMLAADPGVRYVFVTNESVQGPLRPHSGGHILDFPEVRVLPTHARKGYDSAAQERIAPRLLLCPGVTVEVLDSRIERILAHHGHVPRAHHTECIRDLREAVRSRLTGLAGGHWTRIDLLTVLGKHGGSVLPTRPMNHYVQPLSYQAIRRSLDEQHAVVIAGPSGTGKTLTADILEMTLRQAEDPFAVVGEQQGPGHVRSQLTQTGPVLFHLRDPWGSNRLTPGAERWRDELPKLLESASPRHKFLVTSRSDILRSAGTRLEQQLAPYVVRIDLEDYDADRLARIYDEISSDLSGFSLAQARGHREQALKTLTRPYEIQRFLVALSGEDPERPRRIDEVLAESQIDAISGVIADQIAGRGGDGIVGATIIWAMLSARGAVAADVFPKLLRRMRSLDPMLRPDLDGLTDFLVAGRNLRHDSDTLSFYHPRVEDGLRMAMLGHRSEAEHVLSRLIDALAAWDVPGGDWGIETVLGILRAVTKLENVELELADATHSHLDAYLEAAAIGAKRQNDFERAFSDLASYGSITHVPARVVRLLTPDKPPRRPGFFADTWRPRTVGSSEVTRLRSDPRTQPLVERFIREILPFSRTHYDAAVVTLLRQLGGALTDTFSDALDTILALGGPSANIDAIVAGTLDADAPDFDGVIDRVAQALAAVDDWLDREYTADALRAEEHELDAVHADRILEDPSERYYAPQHAMQVVVGLRRTREGLEWTNTHPHRDRVVDALADLFGPSTMTTPSGEDLRLLLECAGQWTRNRAWMAAAQHWDPSLNDLLERELARSDVNDDRLRRTLVEIAALQSEGDPIPLLARIAPIVSVERRLEMVRDVMSAAANAGQREARDGDVRRERAGRLADTFNSPEVELGHALINVLANEDMWKIAETLSEPVLSLLVHVLTSAPPSIAAPLLCLAAAAGIDSVATAERLLAIGDVAAGVAAVQAMSVDRSPAAIDGLWSAFQHPRYAVRRNALLTLAERVQLEDRSRLLTAADDRSADVRLGWAEVMKEKRWPEAIDSLVKLIGDHRDFSSDYSHQFRAKHSVARRAAQALGEYEVLPTAALDALLAAATDWRNQDPFVACAAVSALATKDDARIAPALLSALSSPSLPGAPLYRPITQAASWALLDRVNAGKLTLEDDRLIEAATQEGYEIAGPLLMAFGIGDGVPREILLTRLASLPLRLELVLVAAAAADRLPGASTTSIFRGLAKLSTGTGPDALDPAERSVLDAWSRSLDETADVQRYTAWLASTVFGLPVRAQLPDPRAFRLPERIGFLTMRSLSPAREEDSGPDVGT
jgi:hypothetical protein